VEAGGFIQRPLVYRGGAEQIGVDRINSGGIGNGAASIILVFAVLCLTIFTLITLTTASAEKRLSDEAARMVLGYYEADTLAEHVYAEIMASGRPPSSVLGVDINVTEANGQTLVSFVCPVNDRKELAVELAYDGTNYEITVWKLNDTVEWDSGNNRTFFEGFSFDYKGNTHIFRNE